VACFNSIRNRWFSSSVLVAKITLKSIEARGLITYQFSDMRQFATDTDDRIAIGRGLVRQPADDSQN
jgi:hypothetical protein